MMALVGTYMYPLKFNSKLVCGQAHFSSLLSSTTLIFSGIKLIYTGELKTKTKFANLIIFFCVYCMCIVLMMIIIYFTI